MRTWLAVRDNRDKMKVATLSVIAGLVLYQLVAEVTSFDASTLF